MQRDDLYKELEDNMYGVYKGTIKIGGSGYSYTTIVNKLLDKVQELKHACNPDYLHNTEISAFMYTIHKEVKYVDSLYYDSISQRATNEMKAKLDMAIKDSNSQIHLDLFMLFNKIDELKSNNDR